MAEAVGRAEEKWECLPIYPGDIIAWTSDQIRRVTQNPDPSQSTVLRVVRVGDTPPFSSLRDLLTTSTRHFKQLAHYAGAVSLARISCYGPAPIPAETIAPKELAMIQSSLFPEDHALVADIPLVRPAAAGISPEKAANIARGIEAYIKDAQSQDPVYLGDFTREGMNTEALVLEQFTAGHVADAPDIRTYITDVDSYFLKTRR